MSETEEITVTYIYFLFKLIPVAFVESRLFTSLKTILTKIDIVGFCDGRKEANVDYS